MGRGVVALAFGEGALWAANYADGTIARIDPATNEVTPTRMPGNLQGIAAGEGSAWVSVVGGTSAGPLSTAACGPLESGGKSPDLLIVSDFPLQAAELARTYAPDPGCDPLRAPAPRVPGRQLRRRLPSVRRRDGAGRRVERRQVHGKREGVCGGRAGRGRHRPVQLRLRSVGTSDHEPGAQRPCAGDQPLEHIRGPDTRSPIEPAAGGTREPLPDRGAALLPRGRRTTRSRAWLPPSSRGRLGLKRVYLLDSSPRALVLADAQGRGSRPPRASSGSASRGAKLGARSDELRRARRPGCARPPRRRLPRRLVRTRRRRRHHGAARSTRCRRRPDRERRLLRSLCSSLPGLGGGGHVCRADRGSGRRSRAGRGSDWCASSPPPSRKARETSAASRRRCRRSSCSSRRSRAPTARASPCSSSYAKHKSRTASSAASASTRAGTSRRE